MSPIQITVILNAANVVGALAGTFLLGFFGRKTLMLSSQLVCIVGLLGMFIFSPVVYESSSLQIALTVIFLFGFQTGPGPIVWLYISEICNDQATSVDTVVNWTWTLIISVTVLPLNNSLHNYTWLLFCLTNILGFIYVVIFMEEAMGLSKEQAKSLYYKNASEYSQVRAI